MFNVVMVCLLMRVVLFHVLCFVACLLLFVLCVPLCVCMFPQCVHCLSLFCSAWSRCVDHCLDVFIVCVLNECLVFGVFIDMSSMRLSSLCSRCVYWFVFA